ncbi:MAG: metal ABC transporter permease [Gammaproteobacteria bacterium]
MEFLHAAGAHAFLQYALAAGLLASVGCGVMGTCVVVRRIGFLAGGIAHAVLGGMGAAWYFGAPPMAGAVIAALVAALIIGWVSLRRGEHEDVLVGAVWSVGMAIGVLFIAKTPGYGADLMNYLFGNILLVTPRSLALMAGLDAVIVAVVFLAYKPLLAVMFDEEYARLRGVPTTFFHLLLLCLVALTIVLLLPVVGLILVLALLTLPAAIAAHMARSVARMMLVASILGFVFTTGGLALAYEPDLPPGATIVLIAGFAYVVTVAVTALRRRRHAARGACPGR